MRIKIFCLILIILMIGIIFTGCKEIPEESGESLVSSEPLAPWAVKKNTPQNYLIITDDSVPLPVSKFDSEDSAKISSNVDLIMGRIRRSMRTEFNFIKAVESDGHIEALRYVWDDKAPKNANAYYYYCIFDCGNGRKVFVFFDNTFILEDPYRTPYLEICYLYDTEKTKKSSYDEMMINFINPLDLK